MDIFNCTPDKLAQHLSENPRIYVGVRSFIEGLKGKQVFSKELEGGLERALNHLEAANKISTESSYFMFKIYDSWAERTGQISDGYAIYQKVNNEMVEKVGLGSSGAAERDDVIGQLKKHKINRVFTLHIPFEGYCGLQDYHDDDGDAVGYNVLDDQDIKALNEEDIEVIVTAP